MFKEAHQHSNPHASITMRATILAAFVGAVIAGCGGDSSSSPQQAKLAAAVTRSIDVSTLTIADLQKGYKDGSFTAEQVMVAYLEQIKQYEPSYNAFTFESSTALEQAREVDRKRRAGEKLGPLAGIPMIIKESVDVQGYPSTAGWSLLAPAVGGIELKPIKSAASAERLIAAGAIVMGKGNIPTFSDDNTRANSSWAGPTYNTIDKTIVPGGSSAGVATAIAAGFVTAGLAEETGGSIQSPSSAQSLVGIKPTFGLVPNSGVWPLGGSARDVIGPIANNVQDAAILLDVIAGYSQDDPKTAASNGKVPQSGYARDLDRNSLKGKRIGLYGKGWRSQELNAATQVMYDKAIAELKARGAVVVTDPFAGSGFAELALAGQGYDFRGTESAAHDLNNYLPGLGVASIAELKQRIGVSPFDVGAPLRWYVDYLPVLKASLDNPAALPDLSEYKALKAEYLRIFNNVMDANKLDAMVFPHAVEPLPKMLQTDIFINETTVSSLNIAGLPGVTVPAGQYADNQGPFSLIFVGRQWSEKKLVNMVYDYEQATQHRIKPVLTR